MPAYITAVDQEPDLKAIVARLPALARNKLKKLDRKRLKERGEQLARHERMAQIRDEMNALDVQMRADADNEFAGRLDSQSKKRAREREAEYAELKAELEELQPRQQSEPPARTPEEKAKRFAQRKRDEIWRENRGLLIQDFLPTIGPLQRHVEFRATLPKGDLRKALMDCGSVHGLYRPQPNGHDRARQHDCG